MQRTYNYKGFTVDVDVETDFKGGGVRSSSAPGFVAVLRITTKDGAPVAAFSPLRFGDIAGRPFMTDVDALMGGYSAGRKIIDDLFSADA